MSVHEIYQRDVETIASGDSVYVAAERMHQRTVGALVVVDSGRHPIGIVTDRDLVLRVLVHERDPFTTSVRDVMTRAPRTIPTSGSVRSALSLMRAGAFRRLPVVHDDGTLAGLVTLDDILMLLADTFDQVGDLVEHETPRAAATETVRCE